MTKAVKSYTEDGVKYQFDSKKMLMYVNQMKYDQQRLGKKINQSHIKGELAEKLFVSEEAVKSWMYGTNGPSDLEQVKQIADYFGIEYHQLLEKEEKEMEAVSSFNGMANEVQMQYTKGKVREVYDALLDCIYTALNYYDTEEVDYKSGMTGEEYEVSFRTTYQDTDKSRAKVLNLIKRQLLDIPETLYNQVEQYVMTDIATVIECAFAFLPDEDDPESLIENDQMMAEEYLKEFRNRYVSDLRRIFADFIVK